MQRLLIALLLAPALGGAAGADTVVVNQFGLAFDPPHITIAVGDTVRWQWNNGNHDVAEGDDLVLDGDEAFYSVLRSDTPVFEWTFDAAFLAAHPRPGNVYHYFCSPHTQFGMVGSVTVVGEPGSAFCDCAAAAPCSNTGAAGAGCANSSGAGAVLSGSGSASAAADDLALTATGLLPGKAALLFAGGSQVNGGAGLPFGDGLRCAGAPIRRLGVRVPGAAGAASWGPGLTAAGGWGAGDTRSFQVWYRDAATSPCGNAFNLSNGYSVSFN
jgi:plastocyanin